MICHLFDKKLHCFSVCIQNSYLVLVKYDHKRIQVDDVFWLFLVVLINWFTLFWIRLCANQAMFLCL